MDVGRQAEKARGERSAALASWQAAEPDDERRRPSGDRDPGRPARPTVLEGEAEVTRVEQRALRAYWIVVWPEADRSLPAFLEELGYRRTGADEGVLLYSR
ncbi:MAG: hypothetical protein H0V71_10390 [Chloroflexi bacterium]|nr:hypothetical protein [Chloroflexota bacterium]